MFKKRKLCLLSSVRPISDVNLVITRQNHRIIFVKGNKILVSAFLGTLARVYSKQNIFLHVPRYSLNKTSGQNISSCNTLLDPRQQAHQFCSKF